MKFTELLTIALLSVVTVSQASTATSEPFPYGALTTEQQAAWNYYVTNEAEVFGCSYGDDDRLQDNPQGLLLSLANNEPIEPVQVTYRTLISVGPNTRALLQRNILVASIECNPVYYSGSSLIGLPVIPFEEALTILHDDYFTHGSDQRIQALLRSFQVATIDPRWFWSYFVADKAHLDILGYDFDTLLQLERIVKNSKETDPQNAEDFGLLHRIFSRLNYNRPRFYSDSGQCQKDVAEPAMDIIVWKDITGEYVKKLYDFHGLKYKGKWQTKLQKIQDGVTLINEKPIDNPDVPYFNVTRGLTLYSQECQN